MNDITKGLVALVFLGAAALTTALVAGTSDEVVAEATGAAPGGNTEVVRHSLTDLAPKSTEVMPDPSPVTMLSPYEEPQPEAPPITPVLPADLNARSPHFTASMVEPAVNPTPPNPFIEPPMVVDPEAGRAR